MAKVATAGLTVSEVPYGGPVRAGDLVGWDAGRLIRACAAIGAVPAVGVAAASYRSGETGAMHLICEVSGYSGLTVGETQYLSETNEGEVQSVEPVGGGILRQVVGYAVAPDRVAFTFQDAGVVV